MAIENGLNSRRTGGSKVVINSVLRCPFSSIIKTVRKLIDCKLLQFAIDQFSNRFDNIIDNLYRQQFAVEKLLFVIVLIRVRLLLNVVVFFYFDFCYLVWSLVGNNKDI